MNTVANITMVVASLITTLDSAPESINETIEIHQESQNAGQDDFASLQEKINQMKSERQLRANEAEEKQQSKGEDVIPFVPPQSIGNSAPSQGNTSILQSATSDSQGNTQKPQEPVSYAQYSDILPAGVDPNDPLIKDIPQWKLENFKKIEKCESNGNPTIVSANGKYKGLYQFHDQTWDGIGGTAVAPSANLATPTQQLYYANKLEEAYGWSQWECAHIVGII